MTGGSPRTREPLLLLAGVLFLLLFLAAESAAVSKTDEEELRTDSLWVVDIGGDSVWVDSLSADSIRQFVVAESLAAIPTTEIEKVGEGFHPVYTISWSDIRSNTNLKHDFSLNYQLTKRLVAKNTTTIEKRRSDRANRETNVRRTETSLQYQVFRGLKLGVNFARDTNIDQSLSSMTEIVHDRLNLRATFGKTLWKGVKFTLGARGGVDNRNKDQEQGSGEEKVTQTEEKRGLSQGLNMTLSYKPSEVFSADFNADYTRTGFSIATGGSNTEKKENDDNGDENKGIGLDLRYDPFEMVKMDVRMTLSESDRQFVRSGGEIETSNDQKRGVVVRVEGDISDATSYESKFDYSWGQRKFLIEASQSSRREDIKGDFTLYRDLPWEISSKLVMDRSITQETYFPAPGEPDRTGETHRGTATLNLSRDLWEHTRLRTTGTLGMVRRVFVDSTQDKDDLTRRVSANLDYAPPGKLKAAALFSLDESRPISLSASRSSNNQTKQTWRVSPSISYEPISGLKLKSDYTMTLVYIFKDIDSSRNTMTRLSELRSLADWSFARRATFHFEYRYKLDESGRFEEEGSTRRFNREKEGSNQKLLMRINYNLTSDLSMQTGQFVEVSKRFNISGDKELESHTKKVQIYSQATYKRQVTKKASLNLKLKQTQNASVPVFTGATSIVGERRGLEWEASASLKIEL